MQGRGGVTSAVQGQGLQRYREGRKSDSCALWNSFPLPAAALWTYVGKAVSAPDVTGLTSQPPSSVRASQPAGFWIRGRVPWTWHDAIGQYKFTDPMASPCRIILRVAPSKLAAPSRLPVSRYRPAAFKPTQVPHRPWAAYSTGEHLWQSLSPALRRDAAPADMTKLPRPPPRAPTTLRRLRSMVEHIPKTAGTMSRPM